MCTTVDQEQREHILFCKKVNCWDHQCNRCSILIYKYETQPSGYTNMKNVSQGVKINKMGWYGPEWLLQDPNKCLQWNSRVVKANYEPVSEERGKKHVIFEVLGTAPDENKVDVRKPFEIDETRYSSFKKHLRATAFWNLFINYIKNKRKIDKELTANEISRADLMWIKYIQAKHYLSYKRQPNEKQTESTYPKNAPGWNY